MSSPAQPITDHVEKWPVIGSSALSLQFQNQQFSAATKVEDL